MKFELRTYQCHGIKLWYMRRAVFSTSCYTFANFQQSIYAEQKYYQNTDQSKQWSPWEVKWKESRFLPGFTVNITKGPQIASLIINAILFWRTRLICVTNTHFHEMMPQDQVATWFPSYHIHSIAFPSHWVTSASPQASFKEVYGLDIWICF